MNKDKLLLVYSKLLIILHNIFYMVIFTAYTKAAIITAIPVSCKLVVGDEIVEHVMEVEYLGIMITAVDRYENYKLPNYKNKHN